VLAAPSPCFCLDAAGAYEGRRSAEGSSKGAYVKAAGLQKGLQKGHVKAAGLQKGPLKAAGLLKGPRRFQLWVAPVRAEIGPPLPPAEHFPVLAGCPRSILGCPSAGKNQPPTTTSTLFPVLAGRARSTLGGDPGSMERESALLAMLVQMDGIHGKLEQVGGGGGGLHCAVQ